MDNTPARDRVLALCRGEGFTLVRIAPAAVLHEARAAALAQRHEGRLDGMDWIDDAWLERSTDPAAFLEGARSVLLLALHARASDPPAPQDDVARGRIARYARGRDYHRVFERRLRRIARTIRDEFGAGARATVDYGPLLERPLAARAGLGWLGKSTMLLVPGFGPWVLLGAVVTTLELEPDEPIRKSCGSCTRCVVACPTGALGSDGTVLDSRLCISYHTIENRGPIPRDLRPRFGDWVFGCDDCLDSCPVGATRYDTEPEFAARDRAGAFPPLAGLLELDDAAFEARFRGRAIMRAKRDGLARNACVALGNTGTAADRDALIRALRGDRSTLVRGHAAWALGRLAWRGVLAARDVHGVLEHRAAEEADPSVLDEIEHALLALDRSP